MLSAVHQGDQTFRSFSRAILDLASRDLRRPEFFSAATRLLLEACACDAVEIYVAEGERYRRSSRPGSGAEDFLYEVLLPLRQDPGTAADPGKPDQAPLEALCRGLMTGAVPRSGTCFSARGSFFCQAADEPLAQAELLPPQPRQVVLSPDGAFRSVAVIPLAHEGKVQGLLVLRAGQTGFFPPERLEICEEMGLILSMALLHLHTHHALRERVKELSCLYGISRLAARPDLSLQDVLQEAADLLPCAWLYPEIASACIVLDGRSYLSRACQEGMALLQAPLEIDGRQRGLVEVSYCETKPELDEGPFLAEERSLIDTVAREITLIVEQRETEQERVRLQEQLQKQLRHADRLATLGQLSAGVAHELNEPLGAILGFAQLARRVPDLSDQMRRDLDKIVAAALHAREIVGKLMLFARQEPLQRNWVDLNGLITEGLYFLESRCFRSGIELVKELWPDLPEIPADPGQIYQVLINLAVNAIQAMPQGGRLILRTTLREEGIVLRVEDSGTGMTEQVQQKVFMPFFTTKDVGEGTGLGLAVAQGIVTSHGGTITVQSEPGKGSAFEVWLPQSPPRRGGGRAPAGEHDE